MFETDTNFDLYYSDKRAYYQSLAQQLSGLLSIDTDPVTNMAQVSSFIFYAIPELNWSGFYVNAGNSALRLGPYQGKVACVHIPFGKGVCGTVAVNQTSLRVDDVHSFDGHIACDSASNAEIVVPILVDGQLFGVLDIDSPKKDRFDDEDLAGFEQLVAAFKAATRFN